MLKSVNNYYWRLRNVNNYKSNQGGDELYDYLKNSVNYIFIVENTCDKFYFILIPSSTIHINISTSLDNNILVR